MSSLRQQLKRSSLPVLLVLCLAALSVSYASADQAQRPLAVQVIGDPDAAVTGRLAVGTATPGSKALTVVGVIDFLGAGTVHNYFTQGAGNNMQINANVDEANAVGDATRSQWKLVLGSSLDWFSIRRSPAGGTYNEDALFFIEGSTGRVGIATVDTGNAAAIPFTPQARLHVEAPSEDAIRGINTATTGGYFGVYGQSNSQDGVGVAGMATATGGSPYGVYGQSDSTSGHGVHGYASATSGITYGIFGWSNSASGRGVYGMASATNGGAYGVSGSSASTDGTGVYGYASATTGINYGMYARSDSASGRGMFGWATATTGVNYGVLGQSNSTDGTGVYGVTTTTIGTTYGVYGRSSSTSGYGVYGMASATAGTNNGVAGESGSTLGTGVYGIASATTGQTYGVFGQSQSIVGTGVVGYATATSGTTIGVVGRSNSSSGYGVLGSATATTGTNYGVYGQSFSTSGYGVYFNGGLAGTGTKSAIVETQDHGWRTLYTIESPQNWFEDFGQASLVAGEAVVSIEPIFAQTVNLSQPYHVFLTPLGESCTLFVADKSSTSFTVRANEGAGCEIAFDYRIVAARLGYEDLRLAPAADPEAVAASLPAAQ